MSDPLEQYYSYFVNPLITVRFYQIGYTFTFLVGFIGNAASLLTFSRSTLRKISTGCLFIILAVSDILYLLMCVFDYLEFGFKVPFYPHIAYSEFCRFRYFVMFVAQMASPWILAIISIDRWIRTRFPFKSKSICTPKKALIAVAVLLFFDVGLHSHILSPLFAIQIPGFAQGACGPNYFTDKSYYIFYYVQWSMILIAVTCLGPAFFMLIAVVDIFIVVRLRKRRVVQENPNLQGNQVTNRQQHLQKQMFILMFASVCIFLLVNLPIGIEKVYSSNNKDIQATAVGTITVWTILGWIQSFHHATNFYVHCLSSTLFRNEFKQKMKSIFRVRQATITVIPPAKTPQPILLS